MAQYLDNWGLPVVNNSQIASLINPTSPSAAVSLSKPSFSSSGSEEYTVENLLNGISDFIGGLGKNLAAGLSNGIVYYNDNAFNSAEAQKNRDWQAEQNKIAMDFSQASADKQMEFQRELSNTQYQRAVADMKAAGLNPILAYRSILGNTPSGSSASGVSPSGSAASGNSAAVNMSNNKALSTIALIGAIATSIGSLYEQISSSNFFLNDDVYSKIKQNYKDSSFRLLRMAPVLDFWSAFKGRQNFFGLF